MKTRCNVSGCHRKAYAGYKGCYRHAPVARPLLYRIWQAVTINPRLTGRALAQATGHSTASVSRALAHLERVGAIAREPDAPSIRRIVEPFNWVDWP